MHHKYDANITYPVNVSESIPGTLITHAKAIFQVFNMPWAHQDYEMALYDNMILTRPNIHDNFAIYSNISQLLGSGSKEE